MNEWIKQSSIHIQYTARTCSGPLKVAQPPQMLFDYTPSTPTRTNTRALHTKLCQGALPHQQ